MPAHFCSSRPSPPLQESLLAIMMMAPMRFALCTLLLLDLAPLTTCVLSLADEVAQCPPLPRWQDYFPPMPSLGRRIKVACPCIGIDGCGHSLQAMSVPADMDNVYDLQDSYREALTQHLTEMGMDVIQLNLGKHAGNLMNCCLEKLQKPVDLLIAGPPCPPWAGQGNKKGTKDPRAKVFMRVVQWLVFFIHSCGLLAVVLENVVGILSESPDGHESVARKFVRVLEMHCPQFGWRLDKLACVDYLLPHKRHSACMWVYYVVFVGSLFCHSCGCPPRILVASPWIYR